MKQNLKKRMVDSIFKQKIRNLYIREAVLVCKANVSDDMSKNFVFVQMDEQIPKSEKINKIKKLLSNALLETMVEVENSGNDDLTKLKKDCFGKKVLFMKMK